MFHATIRTDTHEAFRLTGQVVPYDLAVLREHVLARAGRGTRVEVRLPVALQPALLRALRHIGRRGIELDLA